MLLSRDTKGKLLLYLYMGQDDIVKRKCKSILDVEQFDIKKLIYYASFLITVVIGVVSSFILMFVVLPCVRAYLHQ